MRPFAVLAVVAALTASAAAEPPHDPFQHGEAIALDRVIPANERCILALVADDKGKAVYGGTTGRAAHLFVYVPASGAVRSLARLPGGVGFAYQMILLPDGSLIGGTQADPTDIAVETDPKAVGHLYRFRLKGDGPATVDDLGVPVAGQGIYALAYDPKTDTIVGNTWPDGHFFSYDVKAKTFKDHGAIAGYRTFETPQHAEDLNRGTDEKVKYPRQVSRCIFIGHDGAYTGGKDGYLYHYDFGAAKVAKTDWRLPAAPGRESWTSLDAAVWLVQGRAYVLWAGGTSDGYLFQFFHEKSPAGPNVEITTLGKPFAQGTVQGLSKESGSVHGVIGPPSGMPRSFIDWGPTFGKRLGGIPHVDGQPCMDGFGALIRVGDFLYAGERDRIGRLVRFPLEPPKPPEKKPNPPAPPAVAVDDTPPPPLDFRVVFAPQGTTTDGSGYTAIEVGKDDRVYVGAARYGGSAWLLRFDPAAKPIFMDKVVSMRELTGERGQGINAQGKIHAKILVASDGKIWFASKQAHEIFDTRPEYGEDRDGYPGGHLCWYDPKTGFSRSVGIFMKQEGLMAGALDEQRGKLYYRSEPKNHFLVYDLKSGDVLDRGNVGTACRYMAKDGKGRVYTVGRGNCLARYDPATGYVDELTIAVQGEGRYTPPYVLTLGPDGKLYGLAAGHPSIMCFDIDKVKEGDFPEVPLRNVAAAAPAGMPVQDVHAAVFGKDGRLYFPLNTTGPVEKGGKPVVHLRLMRFDPATGKCETLGVPRAIEFDEEKVKSAYARPGKFELRYIQGAAVGADGSLYLMGIYPQLHVACFPRLTAGK